ncbi:MAG TPA: DUF885 family protein [Bacillota bacterium]|nr:DUF885 family protein [Bacillota bacterium]
MDSELRKLDGEVAAVFCRYEASGTFEGSTLVPSPESLAGFAAESAHLRRRVEAAGRKVRDGGGTVLAAHLGELLELLEARVLSDQEYPHRFIAPIMGQLQTILCLDDRSDGERLALTVGLLEGVPAVLSEACRHAMRLPEARRQIALDVLQRLGNYLDGLETQLEVRLAGVPSSERSRSGTCAKAARSAVGDALSRIRDVGPGVRAASPEAFSYRDTLRLIFGMDLDELLGWHRDEVEKCDHAFRSMAKAIDPVRSPFEILEQDLAPYDSPEAMYTAMRGYVRAARDLALDHISLPQGEQCEVWQVPDYLADSYPWGGYFSRGNPFLRVLRGAVFLNQHNYRTITRGWVILNAIHECYPGHHAHYVKTVAADAPHSFKAASGLMSRGAPLTEALAMRTETLLQDGFGEQAFPLFVAYRRLHTAVRVWADLALHHFGQGAEAAVELYRRYLGFAPSVARAQVYAQELAPGYFTVYYYGLKRLAELEAACGWPGPDFAETVFGCGKLSMNMVGRVLELTETDRANLLEKWAKGESAA